MLGNSLAQPLKRKYLFLLKTVIFKAGFIFAGLILYHIHCKTLQKCEESSRFEQIIHLQRWKSLLSLSQNILCHWLFLSPEQELVCLDEWSEQSFVEPYCPGCSNVNLTLADLDI